MTFRTLGLLAALLLLPAAAEAEDPAPTAPVVVKTAKERLVDKAADEQRVDNCRVPPEKRGSKPRPDTCSNERAATN